MNFREKYTIIVKKNRRKLMLKLAHLNTKNVHL